MIIERFKEIFNTGGWLIHLRRAFDSTCYFEGPVECIPSEYDKRQVLMVLPYNESRGDVGFTNAWDMLDVAISD